MNVDRKTNIHGNQDAIRRFRQRFQAGEKLFLESTTGKTLQNIYQVEHATFREHPGIPGHWYVSVHEISIEGEVLEDFYISLYGDLVWNEDATESKRVKPKDRVLPRFMDKLGQEVEKGDLVVSSTRSGELEIGQFTRVTAKGTVFLKRVDGGEEFKLYQLAEMGQRNTGLLKLTRDLRDQIMLLKLAG